MAEEDGRVCEDRLRQTQAAKGQRHGDGTSQLEKTRQTHEHRQVWGKYVLIFAVFAQFFLAKELKGSVAIYPKKKVKLDPGYQLVTRTTTPVNCASGLPTVKEDPLKARQPPRDPRHPSRELRKTKSAFIIINPEQVGGRKTRCRYK